MKNIILFVLFLSTYTLAQIPFKDDISLEGHNIENVHIITADSGSFGKIYYSARDTSGLIDSLAAVVETLEDSIGTVNTKLNYTIDTLNQARTSITNQQTYIDNLEHSDSLFINKMNYYAPTTGDWKLIIQPEYTGEIDSIKFTTPDSAITARITKGAALESGRSNVLSSDVVLSAGSSTTVSSFADAAMTKDYYYEAVIVSAEGVTNEYLIITIYWHRI